jgi:hypothetical protein
VRNIFQGQFLVKKKKEGSLKDTTETVVNYDESELEFALGTIKMLRDSV